MHHQHENKDTSQLCVGLNTTALQSANHHHHHHLPPPSSCTNCWGHGRACVSAEVLYMSGARPLRGLMLSGGTP